MTDKQLSLDDVAALARQANDRQEIMAQCHRYCRALDRMDEALLRSVFHPDSTHHHAAYKGTSGEFCGFAMAVLKGLERTQHHLGNVLIELYGDAADVESYFLAYHRVAKGKPGEGLFEKHDLRVDENIIIGGRYIDRFERRGGVWKIAHRTGVHEYEMWSAADERGFPTMTPDSIGQRDRTDQLYVIHRARG